jgi:hypothetical protein
MPREISYQNKNKDNMDFDEKRAIEYLEKISTGNVVRVRLPDDVVWRKTVKGDTSDPIETERTLLNAITEADHRLRNFKRASKWWVISLWSTVVALLGINSFASYLPESLVSAADWVFSALFIVELIIVVSAVIIMFNVWDEMPWEEKRIADRNYQNWLTK